MQVDFINPKNPEAWIAAEALLTRLGMTHLLTPTPLSLTRITTIHLAPLDAFEQPAKQLMERVKKEKPLVLLDPYTPRADGLRSTRGSLHPSLARILAQQQSIVFFTLARCSASWQSLAACRESMRVAHKRGVRTALVSGARTPHHVRDERVKLSLLATLNLPPILLGRDVLEELVTYHLGKGIRIPRDKSLKTGGV